MTRRKRKIARVSGDEIERRRRLADLAHAERRAGETLQHALRRIQQTGKGLPDDA